MSADTPSFFVDESAIVEGVNKGTILVTQKMTIDTNEGNAE